MLVAIARLVRESVAAPVVLMAVTSSAIAGAVTQGAQDSSAWLTFTIALAPVLAAAFMQYIVARNATDLKRTQMMIDADVTKAKIEAKAKVEAARVLATAQIKADKVTAAAKVEATPRTATDHVLISTEE